MKPPLYDLFICLVTAFSLLLVPSRNKKKGQNRRRYAQFHPPEFYIKTHNVHTAQAACSHTVKANSARNMKGEKTWDNSEQKQPQVQRLEIFLRSLQAERKRSASK